MRLSPARPGFKSRRGNFFGGVFFFGVVLVSQKIRPLARVDQPFRGSIVVSIPACHAGDPGSIPGLGALFLLLIFASFFLCGQGLVPHSSCICPSAVLAERLRRTLKARVRKSVGSIPTDCTFFATDLTKEKSKKTKCGEAGYRSLCLMHAKHALYHLSYIPITGYRRDDKNI